jgi:hypothetical protein
MRLTPWSDVIRIFMVVIYHRVLVTGRTFEYSLMSVGKDGAFLSEAPFGCSTLG